MWNGIVFVLKMLELNLSHNCHESFCDGRLRVRSMRVNRFANGSWMPRVEGHIPLLRFDHGSGGRGWMPDDIYICSLRYIHRCSHRQATLAHHQSIATRAPTTRIYHCTAAAWPVTALSLLVFYHCTALSLLVFYHCSVGRAGEWRAVLNHEQKRMLYQRMKTFPRETAVVSRHKKSLT